jgi:hypothetical protein
MSTTAADSIAGVETDVLGIDRDAPSPEALEAVTAAHPDPISSAGYCERSTTATNTARTALSETSTLTYSSISTHRSSATISSTSSATTPGRSEMHSDSTYLRSPERKNPAGNDPEPRPPSASGVRICGLRVASRAAAMTPAQRN